MQALTVSVWGFRNHKPLFGPQQIGPHVSSLHLGLVLFLQCFGNQMDIVMKIVIETP